ncbi:MAG: serine/threonine-protein kinase [Planctomycetota bacterium]
MHEPDARMAQILRGESGGRRRLRETLNVEGGADSDDLLGRLNALDFVDTLVGEVSDMPERLGDYRITGLLGRGGMGTVYEAFQESLEREVALKVLSPTFSNDPTMRARFRSEARATASLHHAHIVPIYDFGETGGVLYFAMEKIVGVSLDKHIAAAQRRRRWVMDPREAAGRFAGVAEALGHAHRRRILHRDVKPGNLLVAPDDSLLLVDFGLSKIVGEHSRNLTAGGAFLGTLSYASPEQARGESPAPPGDLYSLGVTLFEAVTGQLPLSGENTESMLQALLHGRPARLREVVPRSPRDLDAVLDRLLQKDPRDRYADGEELARDLRRVAEGEPVRVRRQPLWVRLWRRAKRRPELAASIAVASLLALLSLTLVVANWRVRQDSQEVEHRNELQLAMTAAARQEGGAFGPPGLLSSLVGVDAPLVESGDDVIAHLDRAAALMPGDPLCGELREAYDDDPVPDATAFLAEGRGYRAQRLLDDAIDQAGEAFALGDQATRLRLYRIRLARAVASLTASVDQFDGARLDAFAASLIRPGAFLPKLLLQLVEWSPSQGGGALVDSVTDLVAGGPAGASYAGGLLLRAVSGIGCSTRSNLARIDMPYETRRVLFEASRQLAPSAAIEDAPWVGLEVSLAETARKAISVIGDRPALEATLASGAAALDRDVHPASRLQSWRRVFAILRDPSREISIGDASWEREVRACVDLLRLDPGELFVKSIGARVDALGAGHANALPLLTLRGAIARRSRSSEALLAASQAWYAVDPDAPGPLLCRFQGFVLAGRLQEAACCGAEVLQKVVERDAAQRELLSVLRDAEQHGPGDTGAWRGLREQFEALRP